MDLSADETDHLITHSNQQHSVTTSLVTTSGSSNVVCPGLGDSSGNSADPSSTSSSTPGSSSSSGSSTSSKSHTSIGAIIGGVAAGVVAALAGVAIFFLCRRRRSNKGRIDLDSPAHGAISPTVRDTTPYTYVPTAYPAPETPHTPYPNQGPNQMSYASGLTPLAAGSITPAESRGSTDAYATYAPGGSAVGSGSGSSSGAGGSSGRSRFGVTNPGGGDYGAGAGAGGAKAAMAEKDARRRQLEDEEARTPPVIVRHRDAGAAPEPAHSPVEELPPAYGDQEPVADVGARS